MPTTLHASTLQPLRDRSVSADLIARVERWVASPSPSEQKALEEALRDVPSGRTSKAAGPVFWFGSGAVANQRLFDLRLATTYGGRLEDALAQSENFCYGEETVIAARLAEQAHTGAYGTGLEPLQEASGIAYAIARDRPDLLGLVIDNLVNHRSFFVPAKLKLLSVVAWAPGVSVVKDDGYAWVTHLGTTVMTLRGTLDGKKAWVSFAVARDRSEVEKVLRKAVVAAEKKVGAALQPGAGVVPVVHEPPATTLDWSVAMNAADRPAVLRALREGVAPPVVPEAVLWSGHAWALFDLMSHGAPLKTTAETDAPARGLLQRLQRDLLPSAFDWMCNQAWRDDHAEPRQRFGLPAATRPQ